MTIQRTFWLTVSLLVSLIVLPAHAFNPPTQSNMNNLPLYYPCSVKTASHHKPGEGFISCAWIGESTVELFDESTGRHYSTFNQILFTCSARGQCVGTGINQGYPVGAYPVGNRGVINIWYYLDQSTEGQPMAYRLDQGPNAGRGQVAYVDAANYILEYYQTYGASEDLIKNRMDHLYIGGLDGYLSDSQVPDLAQKVSMDEINEAWCNPRADDDCSINGRAVKVADLPKYLPLVDETRVENEGGMCEYPICYDGNDKPIGLRASMY